MREIYVTGFGPFEGVPENPSSFIVSQLSDVIILDHELEVSVVAVEDAIPRYVAVVNETKHESKPIVIHFGVATSATRPRLEKMAKNRAKFRIPDVRGDTINDSPIILGAPETIQTTLDIDSLDGFDMSVDAGEYLCNYLYFKSLMAFGPSADVLFVHLPSFETTPEDVQLELIYSLLARIR